MPRMQRLLMLLRSDHKNDLERALGDVGPTLIGIAATIGGVLRLAAQHEDDPPAKRSGKYTTLPVHGLVDVTIALDSTKELLSIISPLTKNLTGLVDWSESLVSIGQVFEVLPTISDTTLVTIACHRMPSMTREEFHRYWLNDHAALAVSMLDETAMSRMGYQQVHVDEGASLLATELAGTNRSSFDGILQCGLSTIDDMPHRTDPKFAAAIRNDEEKFVDLSAVRFGSIMRTIRSEGVLI